MPTVLRVRHEIKGAKQTNNVAIDATTPDAAAKEICVALANTFKCDPSDVKVLDVQGMPQEWQQPSSAQVAPPASEPAPVDTNAQSPVDQPPADQTNKTNDKKSGK